jgi:FAD dependent oxidoreductase TIGR03364
VTASDHSTDDIVVGAGIVGLAVAWHLARVGRRVVVFERDRRAQGASIRNFGMIWPIGQPKGPRRTLALRSRELWREVLQAAKIWHEPVGSIHLAYHDDEASVLEEFAVEAQADGFVCEMLSPADVSAQSPRVKTSGLRGGLWSPHEVVIDPREVAARLPEWLADTFHVRFEFGVLVNGCDGGRIQTTAGAWRAERCFVCTGDEVQVLFPSELAALALRTCKLQMMRTDPLASRIGPMLAAGLTLVYYDAFGGCVTRPRLRRRFESELPDHMRYGIHVMVSQNGAGELTLGDSHEYDDDRTPFDRAEIERLVLDYLRGFFDLERITIASRWHGTYVKHATEPFCVLKPARDVIALVGFGGAGMTFSFGAAEQVVR